VLRAVDASRCGRKEWPFLTGFDSRLNQVRVILLSAFQRFRGRCVLHRLRSFAPLGRRGVCPYASMGARRNSFHGHIPNMFSKILNSTL
jgi:hypothetical protein